MPGVRRPVFRAQSTPPPACIVPKTIKTAAESSGLPGSDDRDGIGSSAVPTPKHVHMPDLPTDKSLLFEVVVFGFSVMALCLQYINLYKTVWWLPHSHSNYALNFYLIDPYLAMFLVILMSRRLVYCLWQQLETERSSRSCVFWLVQLCRFFLVTSLLATCAWTSYYVILHHSLLYSLFLCYPLCCYVILFGFNIRPLFGRTLLLLRLQQDKEAVKTKNKDSKNTETVQHTCSTSPESVRDEVDLLKTDFNNRIKQVLFNSILCAYYVGFVPLCFAQNMLYYDIWWVSQHVVLVWVSVFVMFMVHYLPAKYIDVLHSCALHLGKWVKVEGRHAHVPYNAWSELQVWPQGALVKHVRGLFKAEGINNSAEPGNNMHSRFYFLFHRPLRVSHWLLVMMWALVAYQLVLLVQSSEWSRVISLSFLLFPNYYILFKLMRDYFVLTKVYKDEKSWLTQ